MKRIDPLLRTVPWRVAAVFAPIERVLFRLEADGTVEARGRQVIFREDSKGGWYDLPVALRGVVEFHRLVKTHHNLPVEVDAMERFANKIKLGSPVFEQDLANVRSDIASCKAQAMRLRVSQADAIIRTVKIRAEIDRLKGEAA